MPVMYYEFVGICIEGGKSRGLGAVRLVAFPRAGEYFSRDEDGHAQVYRVLGVVHGEGANHDEHSAGDLYVEHLGNESDLRRHFERTSGNG